MKRLEIEKIAAKKFVEIKGMEYLDSSKYTISKIVSDSIESNEVKIEFLIAKARPKNTETILVNESIPWDEVITIYIDATTGECRVA